MHIAFLNPQGNFDPHDSYWTAHPDFGGQLVYVKEVAIAMAGLGHRVDIVTRQIVDPDWPEFAAPLDGYPGVEGVRIVRIPCGPPTFLAKEQLWPYLGPEWVPNILAFYRQEGRLPDAITTHYADGGLSGALMEDDVGIPFTFTGHSLGAQKLDKLGPTPANLAELDARFHFAQRIAAERIAMNRAGVVIVSTRQEQVEQYGHPAYRGAVDPADDTRFAVIPPGVNLRIFDANARNEQEEAVQAHVEAMLARDLAPDRLALPAIVCSSRLDAKKNHVGLVRAFAESAELQAAANLVIVVRGLTDPLRDRSQVRGEERTILDAIVALIEAHGLWGKVSAFPLNSQQELAAAYRHLARRRSVFALTALYEPFGLAPLEAIAAGLPGVVTRNGGPSESLYDATTGTAYGVLVDPADPADIARGLLEVLSEPARWQHYHDAGIRRVYERYTWQRTAEGYLEAIARAQTRRREPIAPHFRFPDRYPLGLEALARVFLSD